MQDHIRTHNKHAWVRMGRNIVGYECIDQVEVCRKSIFRLIHAWQCAKRFPSHIERIWTSLQHTNKREFRTLYFTKQKKDCHLRYALSEQISHWVLRYWQSKYRQKRKNWKNPKHCKKNPDNPTVCLLFALRSSTAVRSPFRVAPPLPTGSSGSSIQCNRAFLQISFLSCLSLSSSNSSSSSSGSSSLFLISILTSSLVPSGMFLR